MNVKRYIIFAASFISGAILSGAITWKLSHCKYKRLHQEEMDAVWNDFCKGENKKTNYFSEPTQIDIDTEKTKNGSSKIIAVNNKPDLAAYAEKIRNESYTSDQLDLIDPEIHEISYDDLNEEEYTMIDLTLYADGFLADDQDLPIDNIPVTVGSNFMELIEGKDEIFIRNERLMVDYDITRSLMTFDEMLAKHPETSQVLLYNNAMDEYYREEDGDNG